MMVFGNGCCKCKSKGVFVVLPNYMKLVMSHTLSPTHSSSAWNKLVCAHCDEFGTKSLKRRKRT